MFTQIASVLGLSVLAGVATGGGTGGHAPTYTLAYLIGAVVAIGAILLAVCLKTRVPETALRSGRSTRSEPVEHGAIPN